MKFVDRDQELDELNKIQVLSKKKLFTIALYGLRRVGKTRLLLEFLKEQGIYFFVNKNKTSQDLLQEFQQVLQEKKVLSELEILPSWDRFFEICLTRNTPPIVFDEFQNFTEVEPSVLGILQKNIDIHENKPGLIVLSGSLIGLMKKLFQNSKEPLYGRVKQGFKVSPLSLSSCFEFGRELCLTKEDTIKLYLLFGGYPRYYVIIEDFDLKGKSALEIVDALIFSKNAPLEEELNIILSQEFGKRSGMYYSILEAIATGNNSISSIAGYLNVPATSITRQIDELKNHFELVEIQMPYAGKRGIYTIKHPLLEFWFSQIQRNSSDYASRDAAFVNRVKENLNMYYGKAFERAATEFLTTKLGLTQTRRQWGKIPNAEKGKEAYEIDLIAKDDKESTYLFEFKWRELSYSDAHSILNQLAAKANLVANLPAHARLGLVAKQIAGKERLKAENYLAYDFADM